MYLRSSARKKPRGRSSSVDSLVSREKGVEGSRIVDHARSLKAFVDYRQRRDFN